MSEVDETSKSLMSDFLARVGSIKQHQQQMKMSPETIREPVAVSQTVRNISVNIQRPAFQLEWLRPIPNTKYPFNEQILHLPRRFFVIGDIDSGKGGFLEQLATRYRSHGARIFDLWCSLDGEGMAHLRDPKVQQSKVLILHGPSVELTFLKKSFETRIASKITDDDLRTYDYILTSPRFFPLIDWSERYEEMAIVIRKILTYRDHYRPDDLNFLIMREAGEILYSRLKSWQNIEQVKAQIVQLLNTCRHVGVAFGFDVQRAMNIDKAVREASDYRIFKRPDYTGLPEEIHFTYTWLDPEKLTQLENHEFFLFARDGGLGIGTNGYPWWHKKEFEDLMGELGIVITYKEAPIPSELHGGVMTIGDFDHAEIVRLYIEERIGMSTIKRVFDKKYIELGLTTRISTETISRQLHNHDKEIDGANKVCPQCRRASGSYARVMSNVGSRKDDDVDVPDDGDT
jgi:hypothetical protein